MIQSAETHECLEINSYVSYNWKGQITMENTTGNIITHKYKDTLFRTLFGDSKNFLELYNAVADEHYPEDTPVTPCPSNELIAKNNDVF